jgi:transposase InsO family protein
MTLEDRAQGQRLYVFRRAEGLGTRHTGTKPHPAWTNGFVERLHGTILHEHWRVEFRRRSFTSLPQLPRSLDDFLRFYDQQRPHHGYRTRGSTPATPLLGAQEG